MFIKINKWTFKQRIKKRYGVAYDIVELLHQSGQQQVQTLSEYFHTSPLTIRRDLIELEKQGIIERTYGGACLKKTPEPLHDFADKQAIHNREKELIAEYALSYIHDRDTIFMNSVLHQGAGSIHKPEYCWWQY